MEDYQKARVLALMDPEAAPLTKGWQTQQSLLAVGSGRITGKGYGEATQNRFNFLPEHWTDFPFSVWAEEWGFVGALGLLVLFALLVLLCVNAAARAPDRFGTAICLGVAALIFWQLVVNVGMVLGMAPVVGVTLPLISYGGSSMLTILIGLGLVSSVSMRRFKA
jgi:rod shape determining protein RodA